MKKLLLLGLVSISTLSYGNDENVRLNLTISSTQQSTSISEIVSPTLETITCKLSEIKDKINEVTKGYDVSYAETTLKDQNNSTIGTHEDGNCFNIDHILVLHNNQEISQIDIDLILTTPKRRWFCWGNVALFSLFGIAAYCFYKGYTQK